MSQPNPEENGQTPPPLRLAPPEGERLARGQKLPEFESLETPSAQDEPIAVEPIAVEAIAGDESALQSVALEESPNEFSTQSELQIEEEAERFRHSTLRDDTPRDQELGLIEHLNELRVRLMWCFAIVGLGMVFTWNFGKTLQEWFFAPIARVLKGHGTPISTDPTGFFTVYLQFTAVAAMILTAPLLFWQVWKFIEPALTNSERRYTLILVPFSSVLFFLGAGLGYIVSPWFFQFFIAFQPEGVAANWDYLQSILLMAKMLLVFGVMFQVPIVIIFGAKIGFLTRDILIQYWRHAVVLIFTVAAVLTPTWDPISMTACALPPCLLYILSIWLIKWL